MPVTNVVFYKESDGSVPVRDWLKELAAKDAKACAKCRALITLLEQQGYELRRPIAEILRDGVHELRGRKGNVNYRILYGYHKQHVAILLNSCTKLAVVPDNEIDLAVKRLAKFRKDPTGHTYTVEGLIII